MFLFIILFKNLNHNKLIYKIYYQKSLKYIILVLSINKYKM